MLYTDVHCLIYNIIPLQCIQIDYNLRLYFKPVQLSIFSCIWCITFVPHTLSLFLLSLSLRWTCLHHFDLYNVIHCHSTCKSSIPDPPIIKSIAFSSNWDTSTCPFSFTFSDRKNSLKKLPVDWRLIKENQNAQIYWTSTIYLPVSHLKMQYAEE